MSRSHLSMHNYNSNGWSLNQNPLVTVSNDLLDTNENFLVATHPRRILTKTSDRINSVHETATNLGSFLHGSCAVNCKGIQIAQFCDAHCPLSPGDLCHRV